MNFNSIMKKLQRAILQPGLVVKIGTSQFYSAEQDRMITMYILSTPTLHKNQKEQWKMCDYEILRSASVIEIVTCLQEIWHESQQWEKKFQRCGNCRYFNGTAGDGIQFCDKKEIDTHEDGYCERWGGQ